MAEHTTSALFVEILERGLSLELELRPYERELPRRICNDAYVLTLTRLTTRYVPIDTQRDNQTTPRQIRTAYRQYHEFDDCDGLSTLIKTARALRDHIPATTIADTAERDV